MKKNNIYLIFAFAFFCIFPSLVFAAGDTKGSKSPSNQLNFDNESYAPVSLIVGNSFNINTKEKVYKIVSSDDGVAVVDEDKRIVKAVGAGSCKIMIITNDSRLIIREIEVLPEIKKLEFIRDLRIRENASIDLSKTLRFEPSRATWNKIEYYINNPDIATIDNGVLNAKKSGSGTLLALSDNGKSAICNLTIISDKKKSISSSRPANDKDLIRVRLLADNAGINDNSFNSSIWRGIEAYYADRSLRDKKYSYILCRTQDEFFPAVRQSTDEGNDLILASGLFWRDGINIVAKDNLQQKYMILDVETKKLPNICNVVFEEETGSYLAGVIAAKQAEVEGVSNPKFGFIGGVQCGAITRFEVGFVQGVRSVLPNAEIIDYYANSFSAPELGKSHAKNLYDKGVYCIFAAAGNTGGGAIVQAKEYRLKNKNVWVICTDSDQYEDGIYDDRGNSVVLTSMLKQVDSAVYQLLDDFQNGKFTSGELRFGLETDHVGYSISNPSLSIEAIECAEKAREDIISGKISVARTYKQALERGLVPANLKAIDD